MSIEQTHHFEIVTTNVARARSIQSVLPGGRAVHIPRSPVDEDLSKGLDADPVQLVGHISRYKALRDFINIGGIPGVLNQLSFIGKSRADIHGFSWIARFASDTIRVIYNESSGPMVQQKPTARDILHLPEQVSGKRAAILTAITELAVPLAGMFGGAAQSDIAAHLATVVVRSEFQFTSFSYRAFADFVESVSATRMLGVSGGIPIEARPDDKPNPLIDWDKGITVTLFAGSGYREITRENVAPEHYVHGTFPSAMHELLTLPGMPIPTMYRRQ